MGEQKISVGRIVHYKLSFLDAAVVNRRRTYAETSGLKKAALGVMLHHGNQVASGEVLPMIVTRVWPGDNVNGQVFLDGNDTFFVLTVAPGDGEGQWSWPPKV